MTFIYFIRPETYEVGDIVIGGLVRSRSKLIERGLVVWLRTKSELYFTMTELGVALGIHPSTLKHMRRRGDRIVNYIVKLGRNPVMSKDNLKRYLDGINQKNNQEDK